MEQLKLKTYTRQEIAEILKLDAKNKNFARDAKNILTNWGYSFNYSRKVVEITRQPQSAKEKLNEIMIRKYDMDIQTDVYSFSIFLYCLLLDDAFNSMPWDAREEWIRDEFDISVDSRTLRNWCSKFIKHGTIEINKSDKTFWMTTINSEGEREREIVEQDNPCRLAYWKDFWNLKKAGVENIYKELWCKYGCCFYSCGTLELSAFDDVSLLQEIIELVNEIIDNPTDTIIETTVKMIDIKRGE